MFTLQPHAKYQKLLNYLRNNNISLRQASRVSGISPALFSLMIHGKRSFLEKHKITIADSLRVNRDILFDD
tara:strand:+ start:201 stop:413 length:213 start_codon:yes stop_codon:yes gene_type:complete